MGVTGRHFAFALLSRSQLLHVVQQRFCLFGSDALLTVSRHVGRLLGLLALQYRFDVLLVGKRWVELLLGLRAVTGHTFGFVISGWIGRFDLILRADDAEEQRHQQQERCDPDWYGVYAFHHASLSGKPLIVRKCNVYAG